MLVAKEGVNQNRFFCTLNSSPMESSSSLPNYNYPQSTATISLQYDHDDHHLMPRYKPWSTGYSSVSGAEWMSVSLCQRWWRPINELYPLMEWSHRPVDDGGEDRHMAQTQPIQYWLNEGLAGVYSSGGNTLEGGVLNILRDSSLARHRSRRQWYIMKIISSIISG